MKKKHLFQTKEIATILAAVLLTSCGQTGNNPENTPAPTAVVSTAADITPSEAPTPTLAATPTPTEAPTPTPDPEAAYWQEVLDGFSDSKYDLTAALTGSGLKDLCADYFKLGVGLTGSAYSNMAVHSDEYMAVTKKHFNSCTLTNLMKPGYILDQVGSRMNAAEGNPEPVLDFSSVDEILQWCLDNGVQMRGHTIVWHTQTPDWYFREGYKNDGAYVDRDTMLARLDSYTRQIMTYCQENYPGVIYCWDVVNEAVDPQNGDPDSFFRCRTENDGTPNQWYHVVGADYPEQAFRIARKYAADGVKLFYNDYSTYDMSKRQNIYNLCEYLAKEGLIDGIGMQGYWGVGFPDEAVLETTIKMYAKLGLEIQITELSISVDEPTEAAFESQAKRYASIFYMLSGVDIEGGGPANITSVTLFGLMDGYVLYNNDDSTARLFDTNFQPKPAFNKVKQMLELAYKPRK